MEILDDIKTAIKETGKVYCKWKDWYTNKDKMLERVFCYEFYHQFRTLMEKPENKEKYKDLLFHGEMTKYGKVPDFVLHKGQDNNDSQLVAIEVKTFERIEKDSEDCNMRNDLTKLLRLIADTHLNYKYGIFVGVNCKNDILLKELKEMDKSVIDNYSYCYDRVHIIGTDEIENSQTLASYMSNLQDKKCLRNKYRR